MCNALKKIGDRSAVEMAWMGALGLAPFSALFYCVAVLLIREQFYPPSNLAELFFATVFGFYLPYVLFTFLVKYRCRADEF